tara:strand:- start:1857 stop:2477 length:621 start_codon:yes stop_codon:yes gene_type:complete
MQNNLDFDFVFPNNYYILNIFFTNIIPHNIINKYKSSIKEINSKFDSNSCKYIDNHPYIDAGIDVYCISNQSINNSSLSNKIDLGIKCSMNYVSTNQEKTTHTPCGYYLYSRSSTGSKTPLRLSNHVGIMDSGYRGNVIACFDNIDHNNQFNDLQYNIIIGHRLVQICPPNITYPTFINIVTNESELDIPDKHNARTVNGFGSTGS